MFNKYIGCGRLKLEGEIIGFKCEWLSLTLNKNKLLEYN